MSRFGWLIACVLAFACGCGKTPNQVDITPTPQPSGGVPNFGNGISQFYAKNLVYRFDADIVTEMPSLDADIQMKKQGKPFCPDDPEDFVVVIHKCDLGLNKASMEAIFNKYVFNYEGSPLSDIVFTFKTNRVSIQGKLKQGFLTIPFEAEGPLTANSSGQVILRPDVIKANGIRVKSIMSLFGLDIAKFLNAKEGGGVRIDGNDIVIYPDRLLPPPAIQGFVQSVSVDTKRVVLHFNDKVVRKMPALPDPTAKNWLLFWGGEVLFNSILMRDAKIQQIDDTPQDPMWYYMPLYKEQLSLGKLKITMKGETICVLPDVKGTQLNTEK
jgi:hypothetical protein